MRALTTAEVQTCIGFVILASNRTFSGLYRGKLIRLYPTIIFSVFNPT